MLRKSRGAPVRGTIRQLLLLWLPLSLCTASSARIRGAAPGVRSAARRGAALRVWCCHTCVRLRFIIGPTVPGEWRVGIADGRPGRGARRDLVNVLLLQALGQLLRVASQLAREEQGLALDHLRARVKEAQHAVNLDQPLLLQ
eukprot:SAG22_NODE_1478_length_4327_cov_3.241249_5_plen_143_part_00